MKNSKSERIKGDWDPTSHPTLCVPMCALFRYRGYGSYPDPRRDPWDPTVSDTVTELRNYRHYWADVPSRHHPTSNKLNPWNPTTSRIRRTRTHIKNIRTHRKKYYSLVLLKNKYLIKKVKCEQQSNSSLKFEQLNLIISIEHNE